MSLWKRFQRVGKKAAKFRFTITYHELILEYDKKWIPNSVCIIWCRRNRKTSTQWRKWEPTIDNSFKGVLTWPIPETTEIEVTLYRDPKDPQIFEDKEWTIFIEDRNIKDIHNKRQQITASTDIRLNNYVGACCGLEPKVSQVKLNLRPNGKRVREAILSFTVSCNFLKEGKATDEDMRSLASMISFSPEDEYEHDKFSNNSLDSNSNFGAKVNQLHRDWAKTCGQSSDKTFQNDHHRLTGENGKNLKDVSMNGDSSANQSPEDAQLEKWFVVKGAIEGDENSNNQVNDTSQLDLNKLNIPTNNSTKQLKGEGLSENKLHKKMSFFDLEQVSNLFIKCTPAGNQFTPNTTPSHINKIVENEKWDDSKKRNPPLKNNHLTSTPLAKADKNNFAIYDSPFKNLKNNRYYGSLRIKNGQFINNNLVALGNDNYKEKHYETNFSNKLNTLTSIGLPTTTGSLMRRLSSSFRRPKLKHLNLNATTTPDIHADYKNKPKIDPTPRLIPKNGVDVQNLLKSPAVDLFEWCDDICRTHGLEVSNENNFIDRFRDGRIFCVVIEHYQPGSIDLASLPPNDIEGNNRKAFKIASDLGIPPLIEPQEMLQNDKIDKLAIVTYLYQLKTFFERRNRNVAQVKASIATSASLQPSLISSPHKDVAKENNRIHTFSQDVETSEKSSPTVEEILDETQKYLTLNKIDTNNVPTSFTTSKNDLNPFARNDDRKAHTKFKIETQQPTNSNKSFPVFRDLPKPIKASRDDINTSQKKYPSPSTFARGKPAYASVRVGTGYEGYKEKVPSNFTTIFTDREIELKNRATTLVKEARQKAKLKQLRALTFDNLRTESFDKNLIIGNVVTSELRKKIDDKNTDKLEPSLREIPFDSNNFNRGQYLKSPANNSKNQSFRLKIKPDFDFQFADTYVELTPQQFVTTPINLKSDAFLSTKPGDTNGNGDEKENRFFTIIDDNNGVEKLDSGALDGSKKTSSDMPTFSSTVSHMEKEEEKIEENQSSLIDLKATNTITHNHVRKGNEVYEGKHINITETPEPYSPKKLIAKPPATSSIPSFSNNGDIMIRINKLLEQDQIDDIEDAKTSLAKDIDSKQPKAHIDVIGNGSGYMGGNDKRSLYFEKEFEKLNQMQKDLDEKAYALEKEIRNSIANKETHKESILLKEWFEIVETKNSLNCQQNQLTIYEQEKNLEKKYEMLKRELQRIMEIPESLKTQPDLEREKLLIAELVNVVNQRDMLVQNLDIHEQSLSDAQTRCPPSGQLKPDFSAKPRSTSPSRGYNNYYNSKLSQNISFINKSDQAPPHLDAYGTFIKASKNVFYNSLPRPLRSSNSFIPQQEEIVDANYWNMMANKSMKPGTSTTLPPEFHAINQEGDYQFSAEDDKNCVVQ
ncbi:unnamed protein product [Gordionus sp. m RMFG-2023]|uniref:EH domain-binding protein 1-like isoform X2 n=1 Tax=Gordionus sp. m RMFG-2023 TaxID=3053472 RepID=UPI0030E1419C